MIDTAQNSILGPGTILADNYQIIRLIGQGGMGSVYLAYDMRLDLKVAIKVISADFAETMDASEYGSILRRFQTEARISAQIDHPNVIRIFGFNQDTIECEDRSFQVDYLVMELMAGRTLRDTMDESGFESEDEIRAWIAKYLYPVLDGLEKVHNSGIVHRDIKPENFFLREDVVKLADFGLSLGVNQPSITGSLVDVLGTMKYMAPEQFFNFSLAREPADIYSIGKILYEAVDGKISGKSTPLKQVRLDHPNTRYLRDLNAIVMAATEENPKDRISSVGELRNLLLDLDQRKPIATSLSSRANKLRYKMIIMPLLAAAVVLLGITASFYYSSHTTVVIQEPRQAVQKPRDQQSVTQQIPEAVYGKLPEDVKPILHGVDDSILHLIPPVEMKLPIENSPELDKVALKAFYLSETPITNQQYVSFLNDVLDRIRVADTDVLLDGRLVLKLSEKIRDYKPILFDGKSFKVQNPMHSSCALLMVTGYGADSYARYYGYRLMSPTEWLVIMYSDKHDDSSRIPLPAPVINYPKDKYGIRGINQIAEWGKAESDSFLILGQSASNMIESEPVLEKEPTKYYTDTSFRVAMSMDAADHAH